MSLGQKTEVEYFRQQDSGDQILIWQQMHMIRLQRNSNERIAVRKLITSHAVCKTQWLKIKC